MDVDTPAPLVGIPFTTPSVTPPTVLPTGTNMLLAPTSVPVGALKFNDFNVLAFTSIHINVPSKNAGSVIPSLVAISALPIPCDNRLFTSAVGAMNVPIGFPNVALPGNSDI